MKTFQPSGKEIKRQWHLIDAQGQVLGRLASEIAKYLMGKDKVDFSRHIDSGDSVVVINAEKVVLTGRKTAQKVYRSHSGYPGGFKERSFQKVMSEHPERIIEHAVSGMIPDNRLKDKRLLRLKVVVGDKNPYESNFADDQKVNN